jgi:hypothetical protein
MMFSVNNMMVLKLHIKKYCMIHLNDMIFEKYTFPFLVGAIFSLKTNDHAIGNHPMMP